MAKTHEKNEAIELRKRGLSYNDILRRVQVAKSTLSLWLRSVHLAKRMKRKITERKLNTQKIAARHWHEMRIEKTIRIKQQAGSEIPRFTSREQWLMGICLYWAEGAKEHEKGSRVQFSNSDPHMVLFFRHWLYGYLDVKPQHLIYSLYIHIRSSQLSSAIQYWCDFLEIEPSELRIVFKRHNPSPKRKNIGVHYKGLMRLTVMKSTDLNRKISGWIDGIIVNVPFDGE